MGSLVSSVPWATQKMAPTVSQRVGLWLSYLFCAPGPAGSVQPSLVKVNSNGIKSISLRASQEAGHPQAHYLPLTDGEMTPQED